MHELLRWWQINLFTASREASSSSNHNLCFPVISINLYTINYYFMTHSIYGKSFLKKKSNFINKFLFLYSTLICQNLLKLYCHDYITSTVHQCSCFRHSGQQMYIYKISVDLTKKVHLSKFVCDDAKLKIIGTWNLQFEWKITTFSTLFNEIIAIFILKIKAKIITVYREICLKNV